MARVLSGIQPTSDIHLGNYLGAIRHWVTAQDQHESLFCVVDLHALTVAPDPDELRARTLETAMVLLAAGIDPSRCTLFLQSHVPEHTELTWLLNCVATVGELRRMTQFKEKSDGRDSVTVGLFDYPVLQAADILVYEAEQVPVGDDQRQHLELARDLAERFNQRYGRTFVVPEASIGAIGARVSDLQEPARKMSKSGSSPAGRILVLDPPEEIVRKLKRAVTDSDGEVRYDREAKPGVSNLLDLLALATDRPVAEVVASYSRYGPLKSDAADAVVELLAPLRRRYAELAADPGAVSAVLEEGGAKAGLLASLTLARAREAIGLLPRSGTGTLEQRSQHVV
ncbi:MAG: tryptophan--tRNA ligase [Acidimicrobiales bacterium]